ncbi:unnamed protein product [Didymodactylos carnosus]|uniref:Calponin-homology (CH) domain-containing protein n=1 Tax=Didymodactylos carnosus TaxID=1234261 RepID=A0A813NQK6_9BILA|nr:unnamed protein product [Didymodactylos carnosus]CAF1441537.1 unnamed protein product [Didymodactylos carnosus]CAF3515233.1 unnamed protein product [Didymodactylos carnosus]CAF4237844.1 unnamed protein product [Didymodactylos carnosus]
MSTNVRTLLNKFQPTQQQNDTTGYHGSPVTIQNDSKRFHDNQKSKYYSLNDDREKLLKYENERKTATPTITRLIDENYSQPYGVYVCIHCGKDQMVTIVAINPTTSNLVQLHKTTSESDFLSHKNEKVLLSSNVQEQSWSTSINQQQKQQLQQQQLQQQHQPQQHQPQLQQQQLQQQQQSQQQKQQQLQQQQSQQQKQQQLQQQQKQQLQQQQLQQQKQSLQQQHDVRETIINDMNQRRYSQNYDRHRSSLYGEIIEDANENEGEIHTYSSKLSMPEKHSNDVPSLNYQHKNSERDNSFVNIEKSTDQEQLERNIDGLVENWLRHSVEHVSQDNIKNERRVQSQNDNTRSGDQHQREQMMGIRGDKTEQSQSINAKNMELQFDPILGNVLLKQSTVELRRESNYHGKRDSIQTMTRETYRDTDPGDDDQMYYASKLDRDTVLRNESEKPIWARRRLSHSTVKPSDLIQEPDKQEKLEPKALRRLSRADLATDFLRISSKSADNVSRNPAVIKDTILHWCQDVTQYYKNVNIKNFSSSWANGMAFCAIIHRYFPEEFSYDILDPNERRKNFDLAFTIAQERAGIDPLIDTDDMLMMKDKPDWKVVFTYVQSLYRHLSRIQPPSVLRERF